VSDALLDLAVREFQLDIDPWAAGARQPENGRSGSECIRVRRAGVPCVLKLTQTRGANGDAVAAARRELAFYRQVAPHLDVRTPPLVGAIEAGLGIALLTGDAGTTSSASRWSANAWADLGRQVARLHSATAPDLVLFHRPDPLAAAATAEGLDRAQAFWISAPWCSHIPALAARWRRALAAGPATLCHGDLHTGNVTLSADGSRATLLDWQECGFGSPWWDLAFVSVRAVPQGVRAPRAFLEAYAAARGISPSSFERAVCELELAAYVLLWPPYARHNSKAGVARVRTRATELAELLALG